MLDLAPITRFLRAKASSHLLVAAVHYLNVFEILSKKPLPFSELQEKLRLAERPATVLFPALCAMQLIEYNDFGELQITELGKYLIASNPANVIGYTGLEKNDPGVLQMVEWLENDGPANNTQGFSYVKDDDAPSPMDEPTAAKFFTLALAGRAKNLAPIVAANITKHNSVLLDVAAGTGYYSYEWLLINQDGRAIVFDRPEVLRVAADLLEDFVSSGRQGVETIKQRVTFLPGDMFHDELPKADVLLAASLFHDWPTSTCKSLAKKFASALLPGGTIWIHDAFLNDELDGPIAVTDYSAMLFLGTKGRAYSRKEYFCWLKDAGLSPLPGNIPTLMDYSLIAASKSWKV